MNGGQCLLAMHERRCMDQCMKEDALLVYTVMSKGLVGLYYVM
jgi:hypothetical protein